MSTPSPTIVHCTITPYPRPVPEGLGDPMPQVVVTFNTGECLTLFDFYPDELTFTEEEFIGLTQDEARRLKFTKDRRYLRGE